MYTVGGCLSDNSWRYRGGSDQVFGPDVHRRLRYAWQASLQNRTEQVREHVASSEFDTLQMEIPH